MISKKTLLITGASLFGIAVLQGFKKFNTAKEVMKHIKIGVGKISNIKLGFSKSTFDLVLTITNTTNIDFGATLTSFITIRQVRVYAQNDILIGRGNTAINSIALPANTSIELPKINIEVDTLKTLGEITTNFSAFTNQDFSHLKYKVDIEAFGNIITLES